MTPFHFTAGKLPLLVSMQAPNSPQKSTLD
jgi:hypothetical protein